MEKQTSMSIAATGDPSEGQVELTLKGGTADLMVLASMLLVELSEGATRSAPDHLSNPLRNEFIRLIYQAAIIYIEEGR